jgi:hypothetical protein
MGSKVGGLDMTTDTNTKKAKSAKASSLAELFAKQKAAKDSGSKLGRLDAARLKAQLEKERAKRSNAELRSLQKKAKENSRSQENHRKILAGILLQRLIEDGHLTASWLTQAAPAVGLTEDDMAVLAPHLRAVEHTAAVQVAAALGLAVIGEVAHAAALIEVRRHVRRQPGLLDQVVPGIDGTVRDALKRGEEQKVVTALRAKDTAREP